MAAPQNSYARLARQQVKDARRDSAEYQRQEAARQAAINKANGDTPKQRAERRQARLTEAFDALQVGDSLDAFGLCAQVAKKNPKSVVTDMGTRWTRYELTGCK